MRTTADVVIVGAGIVGAACAFELSRANLTTIVVDANGIGTGATAEGMGHLIAMNDSESQFALTRYSQTLWSKLSDRLPACVEYESCGTLWIATDDEEMAEVRRKHSYYTGRGVPAEILDAKALQEAEPHLRSPLAGGLLVPADAVIYPPSAAAFLCECARESGVEFRLGNQVTSLGRGKANLADGTTLAAKVIINAAGQYAPRLTPGIPIKPRKGHLVITDRYPGTIRHQLVELGYSKSAHSVATDSVAFNVQPRITGQILIGSSRQYEIDDTAVEPQIMSRMLHRAFDYLPMLETLSAIRVWTGFRAATPDKLPLIGPWPEDSSVFLAAGHEGLGITTSLGTARLVADYLLNRTPQIPLEPYLPSRQMQEASHV
jgi:glycine/D-amino acid oxidase-like deaminating enzyme